MTGPQFHQTPMGRRFYEHTMPELLRQVARLADGVERVTAALEAQSQAEEPAEAKGCDLGKVES